MTTMRLTVFGAGYSGKAIGRLAARGAAIAVAGTTRSRERFASLEESGLDPFRFDGGTLEPELLERLAGTTHLVVSIAPGEDGDPVLAVLRNRLCDRMPGLRWIGYLSTVGVYGDHGGGWVDEQSPCHPVSRRSRLRVEAEAAWQASGAAEGVPVAVLRLSGIYGPGRNAFVNLAAGTARRIVKPDQVFNRIRVEDIAGATMLLAERETGGIFNVTDDEPAPPQDVVAYAAALMGVDAPPEIPFDEARMTPMARSFYGENKRVSNARIRAAGHALLYPDYRASLTQLWRDDAWRG